MDHVQNDVYTIDSKNSSVLIIDEPLTNICEGVSIGTFIIIKVQCEKKKYKINLPNNILINIGVYPILSALNFGIFSHLLIFNTFVYSLTILNCYMK